MIEEWLAYLKDNRPDLYEQACDSLARRRVTLEIEVERLKKIEELTGQLVFHYTRLSSPDMGGKHRYSLRAKAYEVMEPLRQLLIEGSE